LISARPTIEQPKIRDMKGVTEAGSLNEISEWLNRNGTVMARGKIANILKINDQLAPELLDKVQKSKSKDEITDEKISVKEATILTKIDNPEEQKQVLQAIRNSEEKKPAVLTKAVEEFNEAPAEVKAKVLSGKVDIKDIHEEIINEKIASKEDAEETATELLKNIDSELILVTKTTDKFLTGIQVNGRDNYNWMDKKSKHRLKTLLDNFVMTCKDNEAKAKKILKEMK